MTHRLSFVTDNHRLRSADPAKPACAYRSSAHETTAINPIRAAVAASPTATVTASAATQTFRRAPDPAVASTVRALSP